MKGRSHAHIGARVLARVTWLAAALSAGCGDAPSAKRTLPELPAATGPAVALVWSEECSACHGETGRGDGPQTIELWTQPPNFHDQSWQASVSDARIEKAILEGGTAVGLSRWMPAYPELKNRPDVLEGLSQKIRAWAE